MLQDFFNPVRYSKVSSGYTVSSIDVGFYEWGGKTATLKTKYWCGVQALSLAILHTFTPFPTQRSFSSRGQQGLSCTGWTWPGVRAKPVHFEPSLRMCSCRPSKMGGTCSVGGAWGIIKASECWWHVCVRVARRKKQERNEGCLLVLLRFISINRLGSVNYPILKTSMEWVVSIWFWLLILFATLLRMVLLQRLNLKSHLATIWASSFLWLGSACNLFFSLIP